MLRLVIISVVAVAIAYIGLCVAMYLMQRSFIYHPQPSSGKWGGELMSLPIDGGQLNVLVKHREGSGAVIYFGGNAEDVSVNMPQLAQAFPDRTIYLMHYRGYGGSSGEPSEQALFSDAELLFDRVHETYPDITIIGRSLGTGIATYLGSTRPATRIILITPFDSLVEIAARQFPILPVGLLLRDKYESFKYAPNVKAPTKLITAEHDTLIPPDSSAKLLTRFTPGIATLHVIPLTDHNNISLSPEYLPLLSEQ